MTAIELLLHECIRQLEKEVKVRRSRPQLGVRIEFWLPPKQTLPSGRPSVNEWRKATKSFISGLPKTETEWREKREALSLSTTDDVLRAVDYLTTIRLDNNSCSKTHTTELSLQLALTAFGRNVGTNLALENVRRNTSRFLPLIFLAACCMAIYDGHSEDSVNDAQREFLRASRGRCDEEPKGLAKDRAAVRWLVGEMQRQFRRGLRHRAFELFFSVKGRGIHFYKDNCPKDPDANAEFSELIPFCDPPPEIQASLPFFIPSSCSTLEVGGGKLTRALQRVRLIESLATQQSAKRMWLLRCLPPKLEASPRRGHFERRTLANKITAHFHRSQSFEYSRNVTSLFTCMEPIRLLATVCCPGDGADDSGARVAAQVNWLRFMRIKSPPAAG
ncbi:uncharacterized protein C8A04DRAFT_16021 [Dichotomopilus funicola]|uniref:Uncharacterized protein n=1 Tax=Dichotomopilus funicola TaxID=1934379 RepID=A0AAN6UUW2_9PEZI|nr:hypothetical protein C8A04DRAFT_16021 [Dichotomopilus funicola]